MRIARAVLAFPAALLLVSVPAHADPSDAPVAPGPAAADAQVAGQALLDEAAQLGKAGKLELALIRVREAAVRFPSAEHDCWAAVTYLRLGRLTAAQLHLDLAATRGDAGPKWCAKIATDVQAELTRRGYLAVTIDVQPADAVVTVDDVIEQRVTSLWLPPGPIDVAARAPGFDPGTAHLDLSVAGARPEAHLALRKHVDPPPVVPTAPPPRHDTAPVARSPRHKIGWGLAASGALIAGGGATFHVLAVRSRDRAARLVAGTAAFDSELSRFQRDRALAIGGYALGGLAIGAGVYLLLTGHADHRAVDVALVPDGALVSTRWSLW